MVGFLSRAWHLRSGAAEKKDSDSRGLTRDLHKRSNRYLGLKAGSLAPLAERHQAGTSSPKPTPPNQSRFREPVGMASIWTVQCKNGRPRDPKCAYVGDLPKPMIIANSHSGGMRL